MGGSERDDAAGRARRERLGDALRANLKRRKAQAQARARSAKRHEADDAGGNDSAKDSG